MSNDEKAFARLRAALSRALGLPAEAITMSSSMDNVAGWDSLRFLLVLTEVEAEFGLKFARGEMRTLRSVKGILGAIAKKRGGRGK
jgi:acyl carrier protein